MDGWMANGRDVGDDEHDKTMSGRVVVVAPVVGVTIVASREDKAAVTADDDDERPGGATLGRVGGVWPPRMGCDGGAVVRADG